MRPLAGTSIVSLAVNLPGPVAAARLAALGADVTKVEPPDGDPLAVVHEAWYDELHTGQRVLTLDLKDDSGRGKLDELLADADLLLTSSRPAALARLGLEWEELHARYPRLVHVAIVGHARDTGRAGHDLTYQAEHGLVEPPRLPRTLLADLGGAERSVSTAVALLLERERTGAGAYAEVALDDAAAFFAAPLRHGATAPGGALAGGLPFYGVYEASDGWVALAALEPHFQRRLLEGLEVSALTRAELQAAFAARSAGEWEEWARERDLPLVAVRPTPA